MFKFSFDFIVKSLVVYLFFIIFTFIDISYYLSIVCQPHDTEIRRNTRCVPSTGTFLSSIMAAEL